MQNIKNNFTHQKALWRRYRKLFTILSKNSYFGLLKHSQIFDCTILDHNLSITQRIVKQQHNQRFDNNFYKLNKWLEYNVV